jgi:hypothetical protein
MVTKLIPIPSDDNKIYRQILGVLNFITRLTDQEIDVLAEIIKLNHEYAALPEDKRARFILSTDMRKEMRNLLSIEEKQFNSLIARLKKKPFMNKMVLDSEGVLHSELLFKPDEEGFKIEIILKKGAVSISKSKTEPTKTIKESKKEEVVVEETKTYTDVPSGRPADFTEEETFNFELSSPKE